MRDKDSLATGAGRRSTFESLKKSLVSSQENSQRIKTTINRVNFFNHKYNRSKMLLRHTLHLHYQHRVQ